METWVCENLWSLLSVVSPRNDVTEVAEFLTHLTVKTQSQKDEFFK